MRTLIVALGLAALATGPALAQNIARGSSGTTTASGTAGTTTASSSSTTGGLAFQPLVGGASSDTNRSSAPSSSSSTTTNTTSSFAGGSGTGFGTNTTTDVNAATPGSSFAPGGSFSNDSGNTALGTSPGQTSSGTFAGNSSSGIGADSSTLNPGIANNTGNVTLVPEGAVSVIGGSSNGARVVGVPNAVSPQGTAPGTAATPTPLFDQAAREGRARDARRRAQGNEPRIYGIAPNTERDLTWQMPDDRIIRY